MPRLRAALARMVAARPARAIAEPAQPDGMAAAAAADAALMDGRDDDAAAFRVAANRTMTAAEWAAIRYR
jgi:hypothetical protein